MDRRRASRRPRAHLGEGSSRYLVGSSQPHRRGEERPDLRSEEQPTFRAMVVQRLDAHPIADEEDLTIVRVMDGECEHAFEPMKALHAPPGPCRKEHFRVRTCAEGIRCRACPQLRAQFTVVVDLAIEDDGPTPIAAVKGLVRSLGQVDDAEATMAQHGIRAAPRA